MLLKMGLSKDNTNTKCKPFLHGNLSKVALKWKENKVYYVNGVIIPQRNAYDFYHSKTEINHNKQASDTSNCIGNTSHISDAKQQLENISSECSHFSNDSPILPKFPISEKEILIKCNEEISLAARNQKDKLNLQNLHEGYDNVPNCCPNNDILDEDADQKDGQFENLHKMDEHSGVQKNVNKTDIDIKKQFDPGGTFSSNFNDRGIRHKSDPEKLSGCFSCCGIGKKQGVSKEKVSTCSLGYE